MRYDHKTDTAVTLKTIGDKWYSGNGYYWIGCFSGLEVSGGLLYYNTPYAVYSYDPSTGKTEKVADNTFDKDFYSILLRDGKLYGVVAENPNVTGSLEYLMTLEEPKPTPTDPTATAPVPTEPATTAPVPTEPATTAPVPLEPRSLIIFWATLTATAR